MANVQVRALYDFESQPGTGELSIFADEILTVIRQDVGEGWWEGKNSRGEAGLFPASYVEVINSNGPPAMPPPPLPKGYDDFQQTQTSHIQSSSYPPPYNVATNDGNDGWDDDWDDDDSTEAEQTGSSQLAGAGNFGLSLPNREGRSSSAGDISSLGKGDNAGKGTVRKNFNRFSAFVKSGGEAYIMGDAKIPIPDSERVYVEEVNDCIKWVANPHPYSCDVTSPKKESKLKGLKSYIAYQIFTPALDITVGRRYKQFDWLHHRLEEKFTFIPIPPLPDKQISGRYDEAFIEHRMTQLQCWVGRITRHPVLSQCDVWNHFISCTDEKRWKAGKRRAEKDELTGAAFCLAIEAPQNELDPQRIEIQTEMFGKFIKSMDDSVRHLQVTALDQIKKHTGPYKREFQKIGNSFKSLASAFDLDAQGYSPPLTRAIRNTGDTYDEIGKLFEEQPRHDLEPMCYVLLEYKGMLASFPDILNVHKGSLQKRREFEKLCHEGRADSSQMERIRRRTDILSYATLAEVDHFHHERVTDFKRMMQSYLKGQIEFYQKIVQKLQQSLVMYDTE